MGPAYAARGMERARRRYPPRWALSKFLNLEHNSPVRGERDGLVFCGEVGSGEGFAQESLKRGLRHSAPGDILIFRPVKGIAPQEAGFASEAPALSRHNTGNATSRGFNKFLRRKRLTVLLPLLRRAAARGTKVICSRRNKTEPISPHSVRRSTRRIRRLGDFPHYGDQTARRIVTNGFCVT